jgi:hypothetical protein
MKHGKLVTSNDARHAPRTSSNRAAQNLQARQCAAAARSQPDTAGHPEGGSGGACEPSASYFLAPCEPLSAAGEPTCRPGSVHQPEGGSAAIRLGLRSTREHRAGYSRAGLTVEPAAPSGSCSWVGLPSLSPQPGCGCAGRTGRRSRAGPGRSDQADDGHRAQRTGRKLRRDGQRAPCPRVGGVTTTASVSRPTGPVRSPSGTPGPCTKPMSAAWVLAGRGQPAVEGG